MTIGRVSIPRPRRHGRETLVYADWLDLGPGCWRTLSVVLYGWAFTLQAQRRGEYDSAISKRSSERRMLRWPSRKRCSLSCGCSGFEHS